MHLDTHRCYRALQTHDARFDGQFFTGVVTTGVYCRSTCPAPTPKRENVRFFRHAAAAQEAGFRPCLRCRPELAPHLFAALGPSGVVERALRAIADGALDEGSVQDLAHRLGVTDRHLRRLCVEQLGASPVTLAQNRRILFAKQLIGETHLSFTDIALAAGFGSIRRFNAVMQATYDRSPRQLRRGEDDAPQRDPAAPIRLRLAYSPPYDWPALAAFLAARAIPGVEHVTTERYTRTIAIDGARGTIEVQPLAGQQALSATIRFPRVASLGKIVERLRSLFDLHANTQLIATQLEGDAILSPLIQARPGLRVPGAWDAWELAVRAILGQQVSVGAANTLSGRLVAAYGVPVEPGETALDELTHSFPEPATLAGADLTALGLPQPRARAISALAEAIAYQPQLLSSGRDLHEIVDRLAALPGIGPWTAHYIAMRALREPDAFPESDLGLRRAWKRLGGMLPLDAAAEAWRPWRAYAALYVWQSQ